MRSSWIWRLLAGAVVAGGVGMPVSVTPSSAGEEFPPFPLGSRSHVDRPDEAPGYQVHFVYATPSDGADLERDLNGQIETSAAAVQHWLKGQTRGSTLRTDTYKGRPDISFVRLPRRDGQYIATGPFVRSEIEKDMKLFGFVHPRKIYAVFWEGGSSYACGGGAWPPRLVGQVAAVYLDGTPPRAIPCNSMRLGGSAWRPAYLDFAMLHEILHTLGFVAECAPNHHRAGHSSDDPRDLMYAGPMPWRPEVLDAGRDDYYKHREFGCLDLAKSAFLEPLPEGAAPPPGW